MRLYGLVMMVYFKVIIEIPFCYIVMASAI